MPDPKVPNWSGRDEFLADQSSFLKQMEDLLTSNNHILVDAGARTIASQLTPTLSHYHFAKDPEALEFFEKCFTLLEKLQAIPGVTPVHSYASHLQFLNEVQASINEKLHKKATKTVKRPGPKSNEFIDSDADLDIIINAPTSRAKVSFL
ncbi:hypothetical protein E1B28_008444 [Marasmius oreades]|uniref:Uncharacterized protein n=1 Tax=Marasmius oreades TaxID=181124 RepID=A0A9P7RYZ8_9AGAR|nr:uncharacterized protein E1B28_008444 [Marasmius oreades]KAG7092063.1 hypothetical protein E1B28_008444 [Marasmius oreades]